MLLRLIYLPRLPYLLLCLQLQILQLQQLTILYNLIVTSYSSKSLPKLLPTLRLAIHTHTSEAHVLFL